jgi:HD-GYP domain-containing protein (c-di-GMP phosphodiesterase class II)
MSILSGRAKLFPFSSLNRAVVQSVIDSVNFRVVILAADHTVLLVNKIAIRQFSINPGDFIGRMCPHFRAGEKCKFCSLEKAAAGLSMEECDYHDPASRRWFHSQVFPLPFTNDAGLRSFALFVSEITDRKDAENERDAAVKRSEVLALGTIEIIQSIIAKKDPYQNEHQEGVSRLSVAIASAMGLEPTAIEGLNIAAKIHDLGKLSVPAEILMRPGKLTKFEYALIQIHPKEGYDILKNIPFPYPLAEIVYQHHERVNGTGYPRGLTGKEMLVEAKIIAVAEVVEAMSAHRPYRPALSIEEALRHIEENRGTLYDSGVVDVCLKLFRTDGFRFERGAK